MIKNLGIMNEYQIMGLFVDNKSNNLRVSITKQQNQRWTGMYTLVVPPLSTKKN